MLDPYSSSRQGEWRVNDAAVLAGDVFATLLLVVSIVSLLNCVINDFLPERFVLYTRRAQPLLPVHGDLAVPHGRHAGLARRHAAGGTGTDGSKLPFCSC